MALFNFFNKKVTKRVLEEQPVIAPIKGVEFNSDVIVRVSESEIIDTDDKMQMARYLSNVKVLEKQFLEDGTIKHAIIRNDNLFPTDFIWRVNSCNTYGEYNNLSFSFKLRESIALENLRKEGKLTEDDTNLDGINFPTETRQDLIREELKKINRSVGTVYLPVKFRSTKHFTLNTPLGHTGEYNAVDSNRTFTIIDSMDNFLNSGYGYSIADRDCYLDVSHEGLEISKDAIVIIEKDKYEYIRNTDPELFNIINQRKVVLYKGDLNIVVNMVLSENGYLPFRPSYYFLSSETINKVKDSLQNMALEKGLYYDKSHSGKDGHFTQYIDEDNFDYSDALRLFAKFVNERVPGANYKVIQSQVRKDFYDLIINDVDDYNLLLEVVEEFNVLMKNTLDKRLEEYIKDRSTITPEIRELFQNTIKLIDDFYSRLDDFTFDEQNELKETINEFFYASSVSEQIVFAKAISKSLGYASSEINK